MNPSLDGHPCESTRELTIAVLRHEHEEIMWATDALTMLNPHSASIPVGERYIKFLEKAIVQMLWGYAVDRRAGDRDWQPRA